MTAAFDEAALRHWLVDYLVTNIGCSPDEIDFDAPLTDLAVGSSDAVVLSGELSELLGRTVSPVEFWQYPTINALARFLTGVESVSAAEVAGSERASTDELIAVIGMGCRLPGDIHGPEEYWDFLAAGRSAVGEVPPDRWTWSDDGSPEGAAALAGTTRWGSFLSDVDAFDAEYFEISPREAAKMDPQQRLLLEVTHEALEHAGIPVSKVRHTQTGVFAGACLGEYGYLASADLGEVDSWSGTGGALSIIANRVSYYFDLRGPSIAVDTACSSSLVAVHLACQSLRSGDSNLALAAGVNLVLSPAVTRSFDQLEALSRSGRCHSFDARADGFVRGEGCGVVVLKRLSDAVADGDRVLAVVRGSAVNQDGRSNGLMAPNPAAQMAVLRSAYAAAGVEPREVDYVEAHGTGTLLGDPIEARALGTVLGRGRAADAPLLIGAVKSNLGHLEAAAGVAGFIKTVLALQRGRVPATLGYSTPNPHIPFDNLRLKVVAEETELRPAGRRRRAGVSSFGFGGTNAHVVLEQGPVPAAVAAPEPEPGVGVTTVVVSGKSADRVGSMAGMLAEWMDGVGAGVGLSEVAHTVNHHRARHQTFATVCARDRVAAVAGLRALAAGQAGVGVVGPRVGVPRPGTVFVFSGQGSQWAGMGRRLLAEEAVFASAVAELEPVFVEQVGFSLREVLAGGEAVRGDGRVQPVLMGLQLALTELWRSRGVHPDAVMGHSMGEVTAAVVAGALSVADGLRVIAVRSRLMSRLAGQGAVALVEMDAEATTALLGGFVGVELAGELSPRQSVVAGAPEAVDAVIAAVTADNRFARRVNMEVASHTALMDPVLGELAEALAGLSPSVASIPFLSTVVDPLSEPVLDAGYWVDNVRRPVRLRQAIDAAAADYGTFVEISPHPVLVNAVNETLGNAPHHVIGTLSRDADDTLTFHTNLNATHPPQTEHDAEPHTVIPVTPWHRTRHWMSPPKRARGAVSAPQPGTLLGMHTAVAGQSPTHLWQALLVPGGNPYPGSHRIDGTEVVPLSVLLATLSSAAAEVGASTVGDVRFERPIFVDRPQVIQVVADDHTITVSSAPEVDTPGHRWVKHVGARIASASDERPSTRVDDVLPGYDASSLSDLQREWGIEGRAYPWSIDTSNSTPGRLHVGVEVPEASTVALLDAAINVGRLVDGSNPGLMVPADVEHVHFAADSTGLRGAVEVRRRGGNADELIVDITVTGADGDTCIDIRGLRYVDVEARPSALSDTDPRTSAHTIEWLPWDERADATQPPAAAASIAVIGDTESARALRHQFADAGYPTADADVARCVLFVPDPGSSDGETDLACSVRLSKDVADLVRELLERDDRYPATLWILTEGVREAASRAALRQSCLWGIAGVIGAEQPQLWGGLVDVADAGVGADLSGTVTGLARVLPASAKSILALRNGEFLAATPGPIAGQPVRETLRCRPDAAYLITGGMGALGLLMAGWLADRGARRLVLAGRTALPPRRDWDTDSDSDADVQHRIGAIRALERRGVSVDAVVLDVGSLDQVRALLAKRDDDGAPPIRGVIHAAGVTEGQLLTEVAETRLQRTMWPKIAGASALHEAFPPTSLDFFYLTASAGTVFGIAGQGAYAAGNAYLDCLARARHRQGGHTVSLDWVAWQGLGFGADAHVVVQELARLGSRPITPAEAFSAWEHVDRYDVAQALMAPMHSAAEDASVAADAGPVRDWAAMSPAELHAELRHGLVAIMAGELRTSQDQVVVDLPFAEMGLNSVMAMSIRREVEQLVGLELSVTMLWNHPTIETFAAYLAKQLVPQDDSAAESEAVDDSSVLDSLFDSIEST